MLTYRKAILVLDVSNHPKYFKWIMLYSLHCKIFIFIMSNVCSFALLVQDSTIDIPFHFDLYY